MPSKEFTPEDVKRFIKHCTSDVIHFNTFTLPQLPHILKQLDREMARREALENSVLGDAHACCRLAARLRLGGVPKSDSPVTDLARIAMDLRRAANPNITNGQARDWVASQITGRVTTWRALFGDRPGEGFGLPYEALRQILDIARTGLDPSHEATTIETLAEEALRPVGGTCIDEGCPHYGEPHSHALHDRDKFDIKP